MSKQEDIARIIDALATRGIECNEGTASYLRRRHQQDATENSISSLSLNGICNYLVGCSTRAKAPEWQSITEGTPGEEPVLWTNGDLVDYGKGCEPWRHDAPRATHWMRIGLPKPEPRCKLCWSTLTGDMYDRLGVCLCCIDTGPVGSRIPFETLEHHGIIVTGGNPEPYDEAYRALRKTTCINETMDILLDLWEAQ